MPGKRHFRKLWLLLWLLFWLATPVAWASGPRYVTGRPFFTGQQGVPVGWKQPQLLYFTDPGDLSATVNHAAADALVANAASVWNVSVASITVSRGGALAEHVSGANSYLDATAGMVFPADVMSSNAAAVPLAVIYDADGSITDLLLGSGASSPSACRSNGVTESVDAFDPAGYILHALLIVNGRCTGTAAAQQLQLQYQLTRAFGRVLGLAWSQTNDNVFTGTPVPTNNQALHWPLLHPLEIICGLYTYQCLPSPFTLRPDDVASLVAVYPNVNGATLAAGKQVSLAYANSMYGRITFPTGQGMSDVNVLAVRQQAYTSTQDAWVEASAVSGMAYLRNSTPPFVAADPSALGSMGTSDPGQEGWYNLAYLPLLGTTNTDNLIASTETINPLYRGAHNVGPYGAGVIAPAGSAPAAQRALGVGSYNGTLMMFNMADAPATCGSGQDGTATAPEDAPATGWWTGLLCPFGHSSYLQLSVRPNRTLTLEATALDANGLATLTKAMPVLAMYQPGDAASGPTVGVAPVAFQALSAATTTLTASTGNLTQMRLAVADQRGGGRPDFNFQGRIFYADRLAPARIAAAGARVTISGMGFRAGNTVLVNGVVATVVSYSPTTLVVTAPTMAAAHAVSGSAVDVTVQDRGTGATSTMSGALTYDNSATLPNVLALLAAPTGNVAVGSVAASPLTLQLTLSDGVTPVVGEAIQLTLGSGSARAKFNSCSATPCSLVTDSQGMISTTVTALAAGTITLLATDAALQQTASFTGVANAGSMVVIQAPSGSYPVGDQVQMPFQVQDFAADGTSTLPGRLVTFTVLQGAATFDACSASVCSVTTAWNGTASLRVTPTAAGTVVLQAADGAVMQQVSFTATHFDDVMTVTQAPGNSYVNENAGHFGIQLVRGDGSGADGYQKVTFSGAAAVVFATCRTNICQLTTDTAGGVQDAVSATAAGTYTVQAAYGNVVQQVTFTVGTRTQSLRILSAPSGSLPINVEATAPFTVQAIDYDGVTPITSASISLAGPQGSVTFRECSGFNTCFLYADGNGTVSAHLTPINAGPITLSATFAPLLVTTQFVAVSPTDTLRVVAQPGADVLYTGSQQTFTVQLLAPDGTPHTGQSLQFSVASGAFQFSTCAAATCTVVTDAQGLATVQGSSATAGNVTLQAAFAPAGATAITQQVSFTETARPDTMHLVSAPSGTVYTGSVAATAFAVQVLAGDGSLASGRSVVLSVSSGSASFSGCVTTCTLITDSNGMVQAQVTPAAAGTVTLLAAEATASGTISVSATFTAVDRPDTMQLVSAPADGSFVGLVASPVFTVKVLQGDGATARAGVAVTLSVVSGSAVLQACGAASCTVTTDAQGIASSAVTPQAASVIGLQAVDGALTQTASFRAVNRPDVLTLVSAPADGAVINVVASTPFRVRLMKADGVTPSTGQSVTLSADANAATLNACSASPCVLVTDASGYVQSTVTPLQAGAITLRAVDGTLAVAATFNAVKPDMMQLVSAPADGSFVGLVASPVFAVKVLQGDGATARAGASVTLSVASGSAMLQACGAASCTVTTDAQGIASSGVTPQAAGVIGLQAVDGMLNQTASFRAVNRPDVLTLVSAPADGAVISVVAATPFRVRLMKADGVTPSTGQSVTLSVDANAATLTACSASPCVLVTDASGYVQSTVTPLQAGAITLRAVDGTLAVAATFNAVKPDTMQLVSAPADGSFVGEQASAIFAVQVLNGSGAPIAGRSVTLSVASGSARLLACAAASCALVTDAQGTASSAVTPLAAGAILLHALAGTLTVDRSFQAADKPNLLQLVSAPADGAYTGVTAAQEFQVRVLRADGTTPVAGQQVVLLADATAANFACGSAQCTVLTDANGLAGSSVTPAQTGLVTLHAQAGTLSLQAQFTAVDRPDTMQLVSAPADGSVVGTQAAAPFTVQVLEGDGTPAAGRSVTLQVTGGSALLSACQATACMLTSDAQGSVSSGVTPTAAGQVTLQALDGTVALAAGFRADDPPVVAPPTPPVPVARPDVLRVRSAPAATGTTGRPVSLTVQLLLADGATVLAGRNVLFTTSGASAVLAPCTSAPCVITTDSSGLATVVLTPQAAGTVSLSATESTSASNTLTISVTDTDPPDTLQVVSVPAGPVYAGDQAAPAFAVRVLGSAGMTGQSGRSVVFTVTAGAAELSSCGAAQCTGATDANGLAAVTVTPLAEGTITVQASEAGNVVATSFSALRKPDTLTLVAAPADDLRVGVTAPQPLTVRLLKADGTPDADVAVQFSSSGNGAVHLGTCAAATCTVVTQADGTAAVSVTAVQAGTVQIVAAPAAASGATAVQIMLQVLAESRVVTAINPAIYLAEGAALHLSLQVVLMENAAPAAGQTVQWTGSPALLPDAVTTSTAADASASTTALAGPLAAGQTASAQACAWTTVCAGFTATGVSGDVLGLAVIAGGSQNLVAGQAAQPVVVQVSDPAGHAVAGAAVSIYQTVLAVTAPCPADGRCPAQPVLSSRVDVLTTDAAGQVTAQPLILDGQSADTHLLFTAGTHAEASTVVSNRP